MDWTLFFIFLAACGAAAATGAMFQPGEWYKSLNKPDWTPPDWVFPVTWTVLYLFIAFSGARIALIDGNAYAMGFFAVQIALNTLWTPVFFGLRRMRAGLVIIVCLWLAVAATTVSFWQLDWLSGLLFVPYLVWVTIATALNYSVWRRNPPAAAEA
ncbi:MAG: tryptophan-rich sensory protein [Rhodobacteraceae bacterium]|nr:tryptophan-rich sensory protein [Paracoccaceae bacterium]